LSYWDWQAGLGELGGLLERWKFEALIPPGSNCVDFGAGGGFLLHNLPDELCSNKMGVEINPHARKFAMDSFRIPLVNHSMYLGDNWADVIYSNHALEHVLCPWCELVQLKEKLKPNTGKIIFVVPHVK
jgi:2-polyprenyl-3-methyl-5-hydroxy-6-metoxy-1,4-benzoquinol methylase